MFFVQFILNCSWLVLVLSVAFNFGMLTLLILLIPYFTLIAGIASSCSFDLTLMICLLRNLAKMKIEDVLPTKNKESAESALSVIKYYRNKMAHNDLQLLTETEFNDQWDALSQVIFKY